MTESIRRRLLITVLTIVIVVGSITLLLSYGSANHEIEEIFDAQLAQSARVLQTLLLPILSNIATSEPDDSQQTISTLAPKFLDKFEEATPFGHEYERKIAFQVWNQDKNLVLKSASAPLSPLSKEGLLPENRGYSNENINLEYWRVFSVWNDEMNYLIQMGERHDVRNELTSEISQHLLTPTVISLPILGVFIWIGIGRGLSPVKKIASEVTRRQPHYLEPLNIGPVPSEIRPLIDELNTLFKQLRNAFERERRFTDDAAHELRTPLAALKTQAQVALRSRDSKERKTALSKVISGVDRATHLVEQMLTIARIDPTQDNLKKQICILYSLVADTIAQVAPIALKKNIAIELSGDDKITVEVEPLSLSILLRNIIDNAINYSDCGKKIIVDIRTRQQQIILSIEDNGPGIPADFKDRVFDRFFRVRGSEAQGCGLGLSIVKQIADIHNIHIQMVNKSKSSGLVVKLYFPFAKNPLPSLGP